jgi:ubiquinone/menaquinone biosynthesis C-methylase UbiE
LTEVDPSDAQIAYARGRTSLKMARFRVVQAQALPFDDNSFDAAAMALVICFVTGPQKAADEIAKV